MRYRQPDPGLGFRGPSKCGTTLFGQYLGCRQGSELGVDRDRLSKLPARKQHADHRRFGLDLESPQTTRRTENTRILQDVECPFRRTIQPKYARLRQPSRHELIDQAKSRRM